MLRTGPHIATLLSALLALAACSDPPEAEVQEVDPPPGPEAGADGAWCSRDSDCDGEACIPELAGWVGGYCTTLDCETEGCHGDDSVCVGFLDGSSSCFDGCTSDDDCRAGYECRQKSSDSETVCMPGITTEKPPDVEPATVDFAETGEILGIQCDPEELSKTSNGKVYRFDFALPEDSASFMVVPFVTEGKLLPRKLVTPEETVDLRVDYRHHNGRLTELQFYDLEPTGTHATIAFDWPILVPYAPQFEHLVVPGGQYSIEVLAETTSPCFYVLAVRQGTKLDLNIHLVDAAGLTADTAAEDPDLEEVLERVERFLGEANISLNEVRYLDASEEVQRHYSVVRSMEDIKRLTATGEPRDETLDGHLSVDVFLVQDITLGVGTASLLGVSAGVPGPPGMHGNVGNGLVFSSVDLGSSNRHVAHIMAHELGHYLGLRHTTELFHGTNTSQEIELDRTLGSTDPIEDTPVCDSVLEMYSSCPDFENLMFPTAPPPTSQLDATLTQGQGYVLRANPTIKP